MLDTDLPDLTLRGLTLGPRQVPIDLSVLIYKEAASTHQRSVEKAIEGGRLGRPLLERLPLLVAIHKNWQEAISAKSSSDATIRSYWSVLRIFVTFTETAKTPLAIASALDLYLAYCATIKRGTKLKAHTKYAYSQVLAFILAPVLGMDGPKLQWKTKIRMPARLGNNAAKENLESTARFVQALLETIGQLDVGVIRGPLPVTLRYIGGGEHTIHCGAELKEIDRLAANNRQDRALAARARRLEDASNKARAPLINLRIDAEMLIFINQTAGNLTPVLRLTGSKFRYQSDGDYVYILPWKGRAEHTVELRIHKAYRKHFEAYLEWRHSIFPDDQDGLTFPFVWDDGDRAMCRTAWAFGDARKLMKAIAQPFVSATQLRQTAGNFMKRKVSRQAAAELLCNSQKTFVESYEEVHHQRAAAELVNFWRDAEAVVDAVGPGACKEASPQQQADAPAGSPKPDCEGAAGCLFCDKNRDLRTFDHVWNLASLHHLKLAEFNADRTPLSSKKKNPAALAVARIAEKLDAIQAIGDEYAEWVHEANTRAAEGRHHPFYTAHFDVLDGTQ